MHHEWALKMDRIRSVEGTNFVGLFVDLVHPTLRFFDETCLLRWTEEVFPFLMYWKIEPVSQGV
jgi:hypothetical protein